MSRRVPRFVKSALAFVCNVRLNGSIRWKDDNVFDLIFHTTAEALCFVKKLAKFFTTMFHLTSFYGNGGTKFPKIAERRLSQALSSPLEGQYGESGKAPAVGISFCRTATLLHCNFAAVIQSVQAEERTEDCVRLGSSGGTIRPNYKLLSGLTARFQSSTDLR